MLLLLLLIPGLLAVGCQPEEEFDEAALIKVDHYVKDITEAMIDTLPDLLGWVREPYSYNYPLRYDEERRQWLEEHKNNLEAIRARHLTDDFPSEQLIAGWQIMLVRGDREWLLDGPELVEALAALEELYNDISKTIDLIIIKNGELSQPESDRVLELVEQIEPEVEAVRLLLFR